MQGIARACIPDPDSVLRELLVGAIEDCKAWHSPQLRRPAAQQADGQLLPAAAERSGR